MAEKDIKAHIAKVRAQISGEAQPAATVEETTTQAPAVEEEEEAAPEAPTSEE
jgi:hypothetical protein